MSFGLAPVCAVPAEQIIRVPAPQIAEEIVQVPGVQTREIVRVPQNEYQEEMVQCPVEFDLGEDGEEGGAASPHAIMSAYERHLGAWGHQGWVVRSTFVEVAEQRLPDRGARPATWAGPEEFIWSPTEWDDLTETLNSKSSQGADVDKEIADLNTGITTMEDEIKAAEEQRAKDRAEYLKNKADVKDGISELEGAMKVLKVGQERFGGESHIQTGSAIKTIRKAVQIADGRNLTPKLGADKREIISSLLRGPDNEQGQVDYVGSGSECIGTVEGLENSEHSHG